MDNLQNCYSYTYYVYATEPRRLMLCKIWGSHGGDYEECRLLGYKNPFLNSQGTQYVSATEPSLLMLCKIWGFHGDDLEECRLLGYSSLWVFLTDVSEKYVTYIFRLEINSELGTLAITGRLKQCAKKHYSFTVLIQFGLVQLHYVTVCPHILELGANNYNFYVSSLYVSVLNKYSWNLSAVLDWLHWQRPAVDSITFHIPTPYKAIDENSFLSLK
jgi:hypothetical protein